MLRALKQLLRAIEPAAAPQSDAQREHALQLATAVLLVEVMRSDADIGAAEREAVFAALRQKFALSGDEVSRLVELAERTVRDATDFHTFTSKINEAFAMEQKIRIVEYMWQVAYADGHLDAHENHVMRRIADLLYVPHGAYIGAKTRARG
jgi:uncharacterized tellurite resistance protein B-like protein